MEKQQILPNVNTEPTDCREIVEWLAEAGVTVDLIENPSAHTCSVCRPVDLHVAA